MLGELETYARDIDDSLVLMFMLLMQCLLFKQFEVRTSAALFTPIFNVRLHPNSKRAQCWRPPLSVLYVLVDRT